MFLLLLCMCCAAPRRTTVQILITIVFFFFNFMLIASYSIYFYVLSFYLSTLFMTLAILFHVFIHDSFSLLHSIPLCDYTIIYLAILLVGHWFLTFSVTNSVAMNILVSLVMNVFPNKDLLKKEIVVS